MNLNNLKLEKKIWQIRFYKIEVLIALCIMMDKNVYNS